MGNNEEQGSEAGEGQDDAGFQAPYWLNRALREPGRWEVEEPDVHIAQSAEHEVHQPLLADAEQGSVAEQDQDSDNHKGLSDEREAELSEIFCHDGSFRGMLRCLSTAAGIIGGLLCILGVSSGNRIKIALSIRHFKMALDRAEEIAFHNPGGTQRSSP